MNDNAIITIARYDQAAPAHIHRARLEAAGIPAMVANENAPGLLIFHAIVGGSVELQVFERDAESALEVLRADIPAGPAETSPRIVADGGHPVCPSCGSGNVVSRNRNGLWFLLPLAAVGALFSVAVAFCSAVALLLLIGVQRSCDRRMRCRECGHRFESPFDDRSHRSPSTLGNRTRLGRDSNHW
jgi:hypothetical protein